MKRLIVYFTGIDRFANIVVDRVTKDDSFVYAYNDNELVGMFDIGAIMVLYVSEFQQQSMWEKANED